MIEYIFNGEVAKVCYDINGYSVSEAKVLLPEWMKYDNIIYDTYEITEILQSIM